MLLRRQQQVKYWIDIWDMQRKYDEEHDGYWIAFLRKNLYWPADRKKDFESQVWNFLDNNKIPHARIASPHYDRLIIFTGCDKHEINRVHMLMCTQLHINSEHLVWKASHESEQQWQRGEWLALMQETLGAYDKLLERRQIELSQSVLVLRSRLYQKVLEDTLVHRDSMVVRPKYKPIDYYLKKNFAFILMPFNELWSKDVSHMIKQACEHTGFSAARADDFLKPTVIMDDIWHNINIAEVIIADITVHNPNVFYELGIAHTLGKEVILIKQKGGEATPFDISPIRYIEYENTATGAFEFTEKLKQMLFTFKQKQ